MICNVSALLARVRVAYGLSQTEQSRACACVEWSGRLPLRVRAYVTARDQKVHSRARVNVAC